MSSPKIIIVGAGPIGLYCANECLRYGIHCEIIEKNPTLSEHSKALGVHMRTLELLLPLELAQKFIEQGNPFERIRIHKNGKVLAHISLKGLDAPLDYPIILPQNQTEALLHENLVQKGLEVAFNTELMDLEQTETGVTVTLKDASGTQQKTFDWVIACDGAHSKIRKLCAMDFKGGRYNQNWWLADVELDWVLDIHTLSGFFSDAGACVCFPIKGKLHRFVTPLPDDCHEPLNLENFEAQIRNKVQIPFKINKAIWLSAFRISHRQIDNYQKQRIFFAGDSAHIHSPAGGQGLNTGLQDIQNLIWKLALVTQHNASEALLKTYNDERHKVGEHLLKQTDEMTKAILLTNPVQKAIRNFALKTISKLPFMTKKIAKQMSMLTIDYNQSPLINKSHLGPFSAGRLMPNIHFYDEHQQKHNLFHLVNKPKHTLLIYTANLTEHVKTTFKKLETTYTDICDLIFINREKTDNFIENQSLRDKDSIFGKESTSMILIRPDQYVALCNKTLDKQVLRNYFQTQLGLPV